MAVRCLNFRACKKNTLIGFADLLLTRVGLVFRDCSVHEANGKQWVAFPARPYEDANGAKHWAALIEFAPGAQRELFQRLAVEAVNAFIGQNAGSSP